MKPEYRIGQKVSYGLYEEITVFIKDISFNWNQNHFCYQFQYEDGTISWDMDLQFYYIDQPPEFHRGERCYIYNMGHEKFDIADIKFSFEDAQIQYLIESTSIAGWSRWCPEDELVRYKKPQFCEGELVLACHDYTYWYPGLIFSVEYDNTSKQYIFEIELCNTRGRQNPNVECTAEDVRELTENILYSDADRYSYSDTTNTFIPA